MNKKSDLSLSLAIHGKNGNYANYEQTLIEASSLGISKVSYVLIGKRQKDLNRGAQLIQKLNKACEVLKMESRDRITVIYHESAMAHQIIKQGSHGMMNYQSYETFKEKKKVKER